MLQEDNFWEAPCKREGATVVYHVVLGNALCNAHYEVELSLDTLQNGLRCKWRRNVQH